MIDYAQHLILLERHLREIHDACLEKKFLKAYNMTLDVMTEAKLLTHALAFMDAEETKNRLRNVE